MPMFDILKNEHNGGGGGGGVCVCVWAGVISTCQENKQSWKIIIQYNVFVIYTRMAEWLKRCQYI